MKHFVYALNKKLRMVVAALSCPDEKTGKRAYLMACEHNGWHLEDSLRGVICVNTCATVSVHSEDGLGMTKLKFGVDDFEFAEVLTKERIGKGKTEEWFDNFMKSVDVELGGLTGGGGVESATSSRLMTKADVRNILKDELAPIIEHGVEDAISGIFGNTKGQPPGTIPPLVPNVTNQIQVAVNINGVDPTVLPIPVCLVDQSTPVAAEVDASVVAAIKENTAVFEKYAARFDETFPPPEPESLVPEMLPDFDRDGFFESQEQFASRTPQGRVWCQTQSAADPAATNSGAGELVETKRSQVWFDVKGRQIKSFSACQCLTNVNTYDSLGRTVKSAVLGKDGKALQETEQVYDNAGHVIQTVMTELSATGKKNFSRKQFSAQWFDPMGRSVASAQFGTNGGKAFVREKTVPTTGLVTRRMYDRETGLDAATIDAAGRTTVFTYDATRRRVKESLFKPEGFATGGTGRKLVRETRSQVDVRRGISTQTDALGNTTQSIADIFGRTIAQIDAMGNRAEMVYNRGGELLEQRDPMGRVTGFVYDALGRRVEVILPKPSPTATNPIRKTVYNALGQVVQEIDPLGNVTTTEYDAFGRRAAVIDAESGRTEFTYNATGKMLSLKDPVGNVTSYVYDDLGRMLEETNELGKTRRFEYEGRLPVRKTDRNGRVTAFEYNDFGKPVAEQWISADGKVVKTLAFDYNVFGHLTKVDDGVTTFDYSRDEDGRELAATMALPGLRDPIVQNTEYDVLGRRTRIATAFGTETAFANEYAYTKTGKVESITQDGKRVNYHYDAAGMLTTTQLFDHGGGVATISQTYDGMGRLASIDQGVARYDYTWDSANRITAMNDAQYAYDATSQLTSAVYEKLPEPVRPDELYEYDANGNRKNFETGKNNQLLSDGVFDYKYDDEGNRVAKVSKNSRTEYYWDHRNRLVKVVAGGKTVEYAYDYQNRLVRRNDELFLHDGWQIACSLKNGKVEHRYLWGATQDELLALDNAWTLRDHLNTVRKVVDAKGCVISSLEYNAFGALVNATGDKPLFRYTGKLFDDATGLQWNVNRWYDAGVGRWISEDPIGFKGKDVSLSRFVRNAPVIYVDHWGLFLNQVNPPCI